MLFIDKYTCTGKIHQYTFRSSTDEICREYFRQRTPALSSLNRERRPLEGPCARGILGQGETHWSTLLVWMLWVAWGMRTQEDTRNDALVKRGHDQMGRLEHESHQVRFVGVSSKCHSTCFHQVTSSSPLPQWSIASSCLSHWRRGGGSEEGLQ